MISIARVMNLFSSDISFAYALHLFSLSMFLVFVVIDRILFSGKNSILSMSTPNLRLRIGGKVVKVIVKSGRKFTLIWLNIATQIWFLCYEQKKRKKY